MRRFLSRSVLMGALLVVVMVASACATLPAVVGGTPAPTTGASAPTVTPPAPGEGNVAVTEPARQALAAQLSVNAADIRVISTSQVDWPNGCLGIERPGIMCTDAIVPGYQVILEVNGAQYEVRTDMTGRQAVVAPELTGPGAAYPAAAQAALRQAAADFGLEMGLVRIVNVESAEWPDACLGVPDPTELCAQMITPGYRVTVDANGQQVVYRANADFTNIRRQRQPQGAGEFPPAAQAVRDALARELGVDVESINIQRADPTEWTDSCFGLGGPAESCLAAMTPGYRVFLERDGEQYIYRTDQTGQSFRREETQPTAEIPAAAQAAAAALAQELGIPVETITVVSAEPAEWTDGCLGLGGPAESCLQAITPGYTVVLETSGTRYTYRTDQTGASVRRDNGVTGSSAGQSGEVSALTLRTEENGSCVDVRIDASGVSMGACGLEMATGVFAEGSNRLEQLADMQQVYTSFNASTAAGRVTFAGKGPIAPTPIEQRMIAEWANVVALETRSGTRIALNGLEWHREGGIAGFCDDIRIDAGGHATWSSCKQGAADAQPAASWRRLTSDELTKFYGWIDTFGVVNAEQKDPATADAMTIRANLAGRGTADAAQGDTEAMLAFGGELMQQWAEATPIRFILTKADVDIRQGPSDQFEAGETIAAGQQALVTGVSRDSAWWRVICPDDTVGNCWVSGDATLTEPIAPAGATGQAPIDETGILAVVIRQVYTVDDTAGGTWKAPLVYLVTVTDNDLGAVPYVSPARLLDAPVQKSIVAALTDLPAQFKWVGSAGEVKRNSQGEVEGNGVIITVGQVRPQEDGSVHVNASIYRFPMGAGGQTYVLEREGDRWQVTGKVGASWMS